MTDNPEARKAQTVVQFSRLAPSYDFAGCFTHFGRRLVEAVGVELAAALAEQLARYQQADGYHDPATALIATASR